MSPLMFRIFSLVAIALAALAAQVKARAAPVTEADTAQPPALVAGAQLQGHPANAQRLAKSPDSERVSGIT